MIGSLAGPFGAALGYSLPIPLISEKDAPNHSSVEHGKSKFFQYTLILNIITTAFSLPIIFFVRNRPKTPPSASASRLLKKRKTSQIKDFKKILNNRDFLIINWSFS